MKQQNIQKILYDNKCIRIIMALSLHYKTKILAQLPFKLQFKIIQPAEFTDSSCHIQMHKKKH